MNGPYFAVPGWEGWKIMKSYNAAADGLYPAGADFVDRVATKRMALKEAKLLNKEWVAKHGPWITETPKPVTKMVAASAPPPPMDDDDIPF